MAPGNPEQKRFRVGVIRPGVAQVDVLNRDGAEVSLEPLSLVVPGTEVKAEAAIVAGDITDGDAIVEILARENADDLRRVIHHDRVDQHVGDRTW